MANPEKGEVVVSVRAGEFALVYTLGALAAIEGQFENRSLQSILGELAEDEPRMHTVMVIIWAGLKKHHDLTIAEVGDLLELQDLPEWAKKLSLALNLAQPKGTPKKRPLKAAAA